MMRPMLSHTDYDALRREFRWDWPARLYDEAQPKDAKQKLFSDARFHAFRASAYDHVGRKSEAVAEARTALAVLQPSSSAPTPPATDPVKNTPSIPG